ncbi:hypothetical protein IE077_000207, partial [Cardiosporidium cionae]
MESWPSQEVYGKPLHSLVKDDTVSPSKIPLTQALSEDDDLFGETEEWAAATSTVIDVSTIGESTENEYYENYGEYEEIDQEDCWTVIGAYFKAHGLVNQQLDSFNDFVTYKMQGIIDEYPMVDIRPQPQYNPLDEVDTNIFYRLKFGQLSLNRPILEEKEGQRKNLWPHEARIRNLTYASPVFVDIEQSTYIVDPKTEKETLHEEEHYERIFLGKIPMMLKSEFCWTKSLTQEDLAAVGECTFDQGGYFIINGGEKVLIAQERMAHNFVYVFKKKQPAKYSWVAEIRSQMENRQASS